MEKKFKLGSKLRDTITGFTGIATAKVKYINGCVQYCLTPKAKDNDVRPNGEYFDVQTLEIVDDGVTFEEKKTGGPQHDCPRSF